MVRPLAIVPLLWMLNAATALAAPLTFQCTALDAINWPDRHQWRLINQVVVDLDHKTLEFRVAQSIGTRHPVDKLFQNEGNDQLRLRTDAKYVTATGIRSGSPFLIQIPIQGGIVVWQDIHDQRSRHARWRCEP